MDQPVAKGVSALAAVARILAGGTPPQSFLPNLELLGIALRGFLEVEKHRPKRKEMRERLERVRDMAIELRVTLFDPLTLAYVERGADSFMQDESTLLTMLQDVARRADKAAQGTRKGGGQDRAHAAVDVPTAHSFCALVIAEAWLLLHSNEVPSSNATAHAAANAFWLACGGTRERSWTPTTTVGWRKHFEAAKLIGDVHRQWVRSRLTLSSADPSGRPY